MVDDSYDIEYALNNVRRDALTAIPKAEGGMRPDDLPPSEENPIWHPLKPRQNASGTTVFYISLDVPKPRHPYDKEEVESIRDVTGKIIERKYIKAENPRPFTEEEKAKARKLLRTIESTADVVFIEVGQKPPADAGNLGEYYAAAERMKPEEADIACCGADILKGDKDVRGYAHGVEDPQGKRDVVMVADPQFISLFAHELSHAVGAVSHIHASSKNSVMNARLDRDHPVHVQTDFGSYDAVIWQHIFDKSKKPSVQNLVATVADLKDTSLLYREGEVTVDLSDWNYKDSKPSVQVDLTMPLGVQLKAFAEENGKLIHSFNTSPAFGTRIKKVTVGNAPNAPTLYAIGSKLPEQFEGGAGDDILWARGGRDIFTGGAGADIFRFDAKSGLNNIVMDLENKDNIQILMANPKVKLQWREDFPAGENNQEKLSGTEITVTDDRNQTVSVFVAGRKPEEIKERVFRVENDTQPEYGKPNEFLVKRGVEIPLESVVDIPTGESGTLKPGATPPARGGSPAQKSAKARDS